MCNSSAMAISLTVPLFPLFKIFWSVQEQRHSFYDCPNGPDVFSLLPHLLVESQELPRSMAMFTVETSTCCTNHVLHHFAGSVATPITEDVHPEIVLIPLILIQSPLPVQIISFPCDNPCLPRVCICVASTYAVFVLPTPLFSDVT